MKHEPYSTNVWSVAKEDEYMILITLLTILTKIQRTNYQEKDRYKREDTKRAATTTARADPAWIVFLKSEFRGPSTLPEI